MCSERAPALIGSARIMQARLVDPAGVLDAAALSPVVAAAAGQLDWPDCGVVRSTPPLGPFAIWEAAKGPRDAGTWDGRTHRHIAVMAPHDRGAELSAWTWSRGDAELTPLARYLLHAAKMRYELRNAELDSGGRELRSRSENLVAQLLELASGIVTAGREPDPDELTSASVPLVMLQAGELGSPTAQAGCATCSAQ
jgi:hypothetical protein